ncbi:serine protease [Roseateles sp.]|uniref:trypsin-like serine peptidase n=1 Tax=Roseateles sp. TaxID=1971397 RepID=UPI002F4234F9
MQLFVRTLSPGSLSWLASASLGIDLLRVEGDSIGDMTALSSRLVTRLIDAGKLEEALALLKREAKQNAFLTIGLRDILAGQRLGSPQLQALLNDYEPFFNSASFQRMLPRVSGVVCAVAVQHELKGTGFLIGPNLVMTNYHVIEECLRENGSEDTFARDMDGCELEFIFDYQQEPPPKLNDSQAGRSGGVVVVRAAQDWFVHARRKREGDGTVKAVPIVGVRHDYAVVRLERDIGNRPCRVGGGWMRGWLPLPKEKCDYVSEKRVIVFQHPGGYAQRLDVGHFVQLDGSSTRAWYRVSTALGSSGGAAVDANGELLALHNAAVDSPPGPAAPRPQDRVNQGVRIDTIAADLRGCGAWQEPPDPDKQATTVWSLNDNTREPRPIIGRGVFRECVEEMMTADGKRVMSVIGDYGTFVRFTIALLQRMLGNQAQVVRFGPNNMQKLAPEDFARALVQQFGVVPDPKDPRPQETATETRERWLGLDLPAWVARQLGRHAKTQPGSFPAWVIIDVAVPASETFLWPDGLHELVTALVGVRDAGQVVDIPQLRWLFLSTTTLPAGGTDHLKEDLRGDADLPEGFRECMQNAWKSIDQLKSELPGDFLRTIAITTLNDNSCAAAPKLPRKVLAAKVVDFLKNAHLS